MSSGASNMRQALGVTLSNFARRQLERIRQSTRDRRVWMRASTLLMSARGVPVKAISAMIGVGRDTVTRCCRRWRRYGLTGLQDWPRSGRPPVADAAYTRLLLKTVRQSPLKFGYVFTVWSVGRLSAHLEKATKNQIGPERLRQILKANNLVYRRPRHTLHGKRNERDYRRAKKALQRLKRGPYAPMPHLSSGSPTRSNFTCSRI